MVGFYVQCCFIAFKIIKSYSMAFNSNYSRKSLNNNTKQKHLGCKKVQGQEKPANKSFDIKQGQEFCE